MCWLYASMRIAQNVNDSRKKALFTAASPSIVIVKSVAIHSSLCITLMPHRKFFGCRKPGHAMSKVRQKTIGIVDFCAFYPTGQNGLTITFKH